MNYTIKVDTMVEKVPTDVLPIASIRQAYSGIWKSTLAPTSLIKLEHIAAQIKLCIRPSPPI
jgi:hypothetical protein